jgi:formate dehydrogenase major subunit
VPSLGTTFGRGGATSFQQDLQNADCILIMGSNMAENHPVGFQWVMEAKLRGAKIMHVDPRFTRTSAMANLHVSLRPGSDIVFLGGIVNYILEHGREFRDYVVNFTNAPVIVDERFEDAEDLDGFFSGWDEETGTYDNTTWQYAGMQVRGAVQDDETAWMGHAKEGAKKLGDDGGLRQGDPPELDPTLEHPRCVYQLLKRHFSRYTPEAVERACGCPREQFLEVAESLCANSGRERTSAFVYSVGWTQHTVGVQTIRTAAIVQALLGNMGRTGGGIMAMRGHTSIQGSTDIPTLFDILPGYIPMPHAHKTQSLAEFVETNSSPTGWWGRLDCYMVSLLKAYFGANATEENEFGFGLLPRVDGDHSTYQSALDMLDGKCKGFFLFGENPCVGSANSRLHRFALANLDWLVVRDLIEIESASFWHDAPELETGELQTEKIGTEVFLLPAASHVEKNGSFTNTQRMLQWHFKAVEPHEDCRSDLWFTYHLGLRIREKLRDSDDPRDRAILALDWHYPTEGPTQDPSADTVLREIGGWDGDGRALASFGALKADGSTACGCWIYCGCYTDEVNQPARKKPGQEQDWVALEWGWAWPLNRRILYNRASADPEGKPWSERKKYVWWDEEQGRWTGYDTPDFTATKRPDYVPEEGAKADAAIRGDRPFIMQADGRSWLFVPSGLRDGPFPTHFEPQESPVRNPLYGQQSNPVRKQQQSRLSPFNPTAGEEGAERYPYALTTFRLTEHHTAGGMTRSVPYLAEVQPEMFCEVSPALAAERGLENGGWATIITARTAIEARVLVTDRLRSLEIEGRTLHTVAVPWHWGSRGLVTGASANDLFGLALDPNVLIQEVRGATCDIRPGRRPRGRALRELVESYPHEPVQAA